MGRNRIEKLLARLHQRAPDRTGHEPALRAELVASYRKQHPAQPQLKLKENSMQKNVMFRRFAIAFVLLLGLGAASRAPADYPVEVGKRIEIMVQNPAADWPKPPELEPVLQQLGHTSQIQVRARRTDPGGLTLTIELWGQSIAADAADQLRSAFPAMKDAQITVTSVEANARGTLGDVLGLKLFNWKDPAAIEAAKRDLQARLQADLKAQGKDGQVNVQVEEGPNGSHKVRVNVEATGQAPAELEQVVGPEHE